ncbi:MAG: hypothetical protein KA215_06640, partial [Flavobacterium sp.]|nr:hypothetical protein [Flavobacterium sp.]
MFKNLLIETIVTLGDKLLNAKYLKSLKDWNRFDSMSETELEKIQKINLNKMLLHASKTVPFYNNYFNSKDSTTKLSLSNFPILTKEILREQKENL